jgi:hypothetical protein
MRRGRLTALVAGVVVSWVAWTATAQDLSGIDSCVSRLDPQLDIGYDRIAARCPEFVKQLEHGAWAPWLPRGWKETGNDLSAGGLREFRDLVARESDGGLSGRTPDFRHLKVVLRGLANTSSEGRWSRFKSWLRSILETRQEPTDESWFTRLVSHVGFSQSLRQIIAYSALAAVLLLAAAIVVNELRAAGILTRRRDAARRTQLPLSDSGAEAVVWSDVERAQLVDKPRLLLQLIVRRLSDRGYLPPAGALTVRELTQAARLPEPDDRTRLSELALAAERVRFSGHDPGAERLDESLARGRELLDRLDAGALDAGALDAGAPR